MDRSEPMVFGDWGTSRLRLTLFDGDRRLDECEGPGIGGLVASPADTLVRALAPWRSRHAIRRVVLCGMAGSRTGLVDAPYAPCPAGAAEWAGQAAEVMLDRLEISVAPGVAGITPRGASDVMRGEETQIFGALALHPEWTRGDHQFVLPGTHSKWCHVQDGKILSFQTFLTGELFALLSTRSSLLLGADPGEIPEDHSAGFDSGLARSQHGRMLGSVFEARAAQLRAGRSGAWATGFLSGLLIGLEVAEAKDLFRVPSVVLIGADALTCRYAAALQAHGLANQRLSGEACVLAGLQFFANARTPCD